MLKNFGLEQISKPRVSVILPNYNYARYLPLRIESILNQTFRDFEFIILDDASKDNSWGIICEYQKKDDRIQLLRNVENSGSPFYQWEKGVEIAKGEYIWIAEADDYCAPDFLSTLVSLLDQNITSGIAYTNSFIADEHGRTNGFWDYRSSYYNASLFNDDFSMNGEEFVNKFLIHQNVIPNASCVLFRKSIYKEAGGVDINIRKCSDWLLWLKMLCYSDVVYCAIPLNYFRRHSLSLINKQEANDTSYPERYDLSMRRFFKGWLKNSRLRMSSEASFYNQLYISNDLGNKGLWLLNHSCLLLGWYHIALSALSPKLRTGFIRKALNLNV